MTLEEYYENVQIELINKRKSLLSLAEKLPPKVLGDYYEEIVREFLKQHLPEKFAIVHGAIRSKEKISKECDIIIYNKNEHVPLFKSENSVIIKPFAVEAVIEVKAEITSDAIKEARENIKSIEDVEKSDGDAMRLRRYYLFGFYTGRDIGKLRKLEPFSGVFVLSKKRGIQGKTHLDINRGEIKSFIETLAAHSFMGVLPTRE